MSVFCGHTLDHLAAGWPSSVQVLAPCPVRTREEAEALEARWIRSRLEAGDDLLNANRLTLPWAGHGEGGAPP